MTARAATALPPDGTLIPDLNPIRISSVAGLKRALAVPGVLMFVDRNDHLAHDIARDPELMRSLMPPRRVKRVMTGQVLLDRNGQDIWMTLPKASRLGTNGTNRFVVRDERRPGDDHPGRVVAYRLERPGSAGAVRSSELPSSHPPVAAEQIAAEKAACATEEAARNARREKDDRDWRAIAAATPPPEDPRWPVLKSAMLAAIRRALDRGVFYNADVEDAVLGETRDVEFAVTTRLPDLVLQVHADGPSQRVQVADAVHVHAGLARGTWRKIVHRAVDGFSWSETMISTGRSEPAARIEGSFADQGAEAPLRRLIGSEVYKLRHEIEARDLAVRQKHAYERLDPTPGTAYADVVIAKHRFSRLVVTAVDAASGTIVLDGRKRGSAKRYTATLDAAQVAAALTRPKTTACGSLI